MFEEGKSVTDGDLRAKFNSIAGANVYTMFISSLGMMISMIFSGHLGDDKYQAALGIGNSVTFMLVMTVMTGMSRALDVLHTASYGNGDLRLCGIYLNRGRLILTLTYIPISTAIWIFRDEIIGIFSKDPLVKQYCKEYLNGTLPAMWFIGQSEIQKRWLIIMRIIHIPAISNTLTVCIHFTTCYIFVVVLEWGMLGLGYA